MDAYHFRYIGIISPYSRNNEACCVLNYLEAWIDSVILLAMPWVSCRRFPYGMANFYMIPTERKNSR